jgi:diguanylate cyclase (GGDEF)-like protein/PAS domain S-box-containing protein
MRRDWLRDPILRLTLGLVGLAASVFMIFDGAFGLIPQRSADSSEALRSISDLSARRLSANPLPADRGAMERELAALRADYPPMLGIALRDEQGGLMASSGLALSPAASAPGGARPPGVLVVPVTLMSSADRRTLDFIYRSPEETSFFSFEGARGIRLALATLLALAALTYFYLRHVLSYLDPSTVVPDRLRDAFDGLTEGVVLLDASGRVVLANRAFRTMSARDFTSMHGRKLLDAALLQFAETADVLPWERVIASGATVVGIHVRVGPAEDARTAHLNCSPIVDARGRARGCLATFADLTDVERANRELNRALVELRESRERVEEQNRELENLANFDSLSGLFNRRRFFELARAAMERCLAGDRPFAVLMMDIDHFKAFNDQHGHAVGDAVIQSVAARMRDTVRPGDLVGRYGGEEFCVLCQDIDAAAAASLAERIRARVEALAGRGVGDGQDLRVTVSVGLALSRSVATPGLTELLKDADEALYRAKHAGRNRVVTAGEELQA